jgi:uncharacterized protein YbjQ (UPF0145 family)
MNKDQKDDVLAQAPIMMTTQDQSGLEVAAHISVISAQCAFGVRVFNDIFASVQDVVNGRATAVEKTMQDGVDLVLDDLKKQAFDLNADAVIALSVQFTPIGYGTSNMTLVSGIGTAVKLAD